MPLDSIAPLVIPFFGRYKTPAFEGWGFVASEGFEPPKAEPADLQSVPFGRLGN